MADNYVITISREHGSCGNAIGKLAAERLGIGFYDYKLLRLASDRSGISEALFGAADEDVHRRRLFNAASRVYTGKLIPPDSGEFTSDINLFTYQAEIIKELAGSENCVIVGRCAEYLLRDRPNVLRVFIHAPFEARLRQQMHVLPQKSEAEVRRHILNVDKKRADYYKRYTGADWRDAAHFDISIDSSMHPPEEAVDIIVSSLETMFKINLAKKASRAE